MQQAGDVPLQPDFSQLMQPQYPPEMSMGIDQMGPMDYGMPDLHPSQPYQPEHTASDFLTKILSQLPERHKASVLDHIFAGISGLSGPTPTTFALQDKILNGDFNDQMQDWQTKAAAGTAAANMERQNNTLAQSAFNTNETRRIAQQRADEYVNRGRVEANRQESMAADREAKQKIDQQKVEIQQFNAMNQGVYTWKTGADGFLYGINNKTAKSIKTDIKSGELTPIERHNLRMDEIDEAGAQARETKETPPGIAEKPPTTTTTSSTTEKAGVKSTTQRTVTSGPSARATGPGPNQVQGARVKMMSPQGKVGTVPASQVKDALAQGYKEVK